MIKSAPWAFSQSMVDPRYESLFHKLVALVPAWDGTGNPWVWIRGKGWVRATTNGAGAGQWGSSKYGTELRYPADRAHWVTLGNADQLLNYSADGPFTLGCFGWSTGLSTILELNCVGNASRLRFVISCFSTDQVAVVMTDSANNFLTTSGTGVSFGGRNRAVMLLKRSATSEDLYIDGRFFSNYSHGDWIPAANETVNLSIGGNANASGGDGAYTNGRVGMGAVWGRHLTAQEIRLWSDDPYGMFRPALKSFSSVVVVPRHRGWSRK